MSYTLEQKQSAYERMELWWRLPGSESDYSKQWTKVSTDILDADPVDMQRIDAEYFIGPTPPRVLSELEGELLEALKYARRFLKPEDHDCAFVDAAVQKAEPTP